MPPNGQTDVPCGACTECCKTGQGLFLHPDKGDEVESYRHQAMKDRAGNPVFLLATDTEGACVYLGPSGCTIYNRRPLICRTFDCRKHYLILPKQDRDNLVRVGLSSATVFKAGQLRLKSLSSAERKECLQKREEFFS